MPYMLLYIARSYTSWYSLSLCIPNGGVIKYIVRILYYSNDLMVIHKLEYTSRREK